MNVKSANGALCATVLLIAACHRQPPPPAPPAVVVAATVAFENDPAGAESRYPIEAAPRYSTTMSFRVAGKLLERRVRLGDRVRKGDVLARLDASDAERQTVAARANVDSAEHRLLFAKQQIDRDTAQAEQNLIAANQLEQTQDSYAAALAARDQAQAQFVIARNNQSYNTLRAEHDGLITSETADTGQVLTAGQAVYGLAWTGDIDVTLDAGAADLSDVTVGQAARVVFPALPGHQYAAKVREIAPSADPQNRTYRIKLTLQDTSPAVRFGMTGEAVFVPNHSPSANDRPTIKIPATALFHQDSRSAVWVIRASESTLQLRPVSVLRYQERSVLVAGMRDGDSGLDAGEQIVITGVHTVFADQHVRPVKPLYAGDAP